MSILEKLPSSVTGAGVGAGMGAGVGAGMGAGVGSGVGSGSVVHETRREINGNASWSRTSSMETLLVSCGRYRR